MKLYYVTTDGNDFIAATDGDNAWTLDEYYYYDDERAPKNAAGYDPYLRAADDETQHQIYLDMLVAISEANSFGDFCEPWCSADPDDLFDNTCIIEAEYDCSVI